MNQKIKVKRVPRRGHYDRETINSILDKEFLCHVGFVHDGYPVVIPTLYGRHGKKIYLHGSTASRMIKDLKQGIPVSVCVSRVNGLVLARSGFHHSANYESVVLFGQTRLLEGEEAKNKALMIISEHVIKGRWEEVREPSDKELKGTAVLELPIDEASAKIRTGGPVDEKEDYELDTWAGELPIIRMYGNAIPDPHAKKELPVSRSIRNIQGSVI
jgi:nitroimidazol reductase NimA-like FMN-containing flavoprotein (pyridoxamine 5'-phosphate oxidase superfamily)